MGMVDFYLLSWANLHTHRVHRKLLRAATTPFGGQHELRGYERGVQEIESTSLKEGGAAACYQWGVLTGSQLRIPALEKATEKDYPGGPWLEICLPMQELRVPSLVQERSYMPWSN